MWFLGVESVCDCVCESKREREREEDLFFDLVCFDSVCNLCLFSYKDEELYFLFYMLFENWVRIGVNYFGSFWRKVFF